MLFCLRYWVSIACDSLVVGVMLFILFRRKVWFVLLNTCCLCNTSKHEHAHATHVYINITTRFVRLFVEVRAQRR